MRNAGRRLHKLLFASLLFSSSFCYGQALRSQVERDSGRIGVAGEFLNFSFDTGSIMGTGVRADFTHFFRDNWGVEVYLSTALQSSGANSFNGFGSYMIYGLSGCCDTTRTLSFNNEAILSEKNSVAGAYQFGLGLNQYLFNGSEGVYSLSGPGVMAQMVKTFWNIPFKASVRYILLANGEVTANGVGFTLGISL